MAQPRGWCSHGGDDRKRANSATKKQLDVLSFPLFRLQSKRAFDREGVELDYRSSKLQGEKVSPTGVR